VSDFVVRDVPGKMYVYELGPQCAATDRATGTRCTQTVVTPDDADDTWTESVIPDFNAPLKLFNEGYGSCGSFCLQLCDWHGRVDAPEEMTGGPSVRFDSGRHAYLIGATHLEEMSRRPTSYRPPRRPRSSRFRIEPPVALYRYWDRDDLLLYVGITNNVAYRERSHINGSSWMDFAARSTIERFPTRFQAEPAEREAIKNEPARPNGSARAGRVPRLDL
jgi:hypothetical protein